MSPSHRSRLARCNVSRLLIAAALIPIVAIGCTQASRESSASSASDSGQRTTASSTRSAPKAQTACDVLTASDIAGILKVPKVTKDESESRKNELNVDYCYWWPGKINPDRDERIQVKLYRAESAEEGELLRLFNMAKSDLVNNGLVGAQPVSGVGNEATYTPFPDGGAIAMRAGTTAMSISGLVSKDALTSMAKVAAQRL